MKKLITTAFLLVAAFNTYAGNNSLQVSDIQAGTAPNGVPIVTGVATNTSNAPVKTAFVQFNLYDAEDNLVGNTVADAMNNTLLSSMLRSGSSIFEACDVGSEGHSPSRLHMPHRNWESVRAKLFLQHKLQNLLST